MDCSIVRNGPESEPVTLTCPITELNRRTVYDLLRRNIRPESSMRREKAMSILFLPTLEEYLTVTILKTTELRSAAVSRMPIASSCTPIVFR